MPIITPQMPSGVHFLCMLLAVLAVQTPSARAQDSLAVACDDTTDGDSACGLILQRINDDLRQALSISKDSVIYTYEDNNSEKIDTGHSCSSTAEVRSRSATARIGTAVALDLSSDALSDPVMLKLEFPLTVSANIRVKQRFGFKFFGSCSNTASDSYTYSGDGSTSAKAMVVLDLNPSFKQTSDGNYEVSVDPIVAVGVDTDDVELDLEVSGVSPLNAVASYIHTFSKNFFRAAVAVFTSDSVVDFFKETFVTDVLVPLTLAHVNGPAGDIMLDFIENKAERAIKRRGEGFELVLEESLTAQVRKALGISGSGKRTFAIDKGYKQALQYGGSLSDITVKSDLFCTWTFSWSNSAARTGGGGIHGPDALGTRCTAALAGQTKRSGNTTYRCRSEKFPEGTAPPDTYVPC